MRDLNVPGVIVYDDAQTAVEASGTVIVMFASEPNLKSVKEFVKSLPQDVWKQDGKVLVNFASQEPYAALELDQLTESLGLDHVGGAMIAIPETICSPASVVFTSSSQRSEQALTRVTPTLEALGRLEIFAGDVGYGALVDIAMIQTLWFGITGFELSLLFIEKYGAPKSISDRFVALAQELFPIYMPIFFGQVAASIGNRDWNNCYMTTASQVLALEMHIAFLKRVGIAEAGIFNGIYLKYIKKLQKAEPDSACSAVVKYYSKDKFQFSETRADSNDEL